MVVLNFFRKKQNNNGSRPVCADCLIDLRQVVKTFHTPAGNFTALKGIDLQVMRGEFVAVVGKSGSGKSTLINMITGIDKPTSGEVWVDGTPIHKLSEEKIAVWRRRSIGIVFQFFQLLPTLTSVENILLPMDYNGDPRRNQRPERGLDLLGQIGMQEHTHQVPNALSGGQQQAVAIARALANGPPLILADEPTGNLDSRTAEVVFELFESLVDRGKTIVMVTHDPELAHRTRRRITLADGLIVSDVEQSAAAPTSAALPAQEVTP